MDGNLKSREKQQTQTANNSSTEQYRSLHSNGICCPNCKQPVDRSFELCPNCGFRLHSNHCTYCGAPMENDDLFCGECGGNSEGTPCPVCGTLSFRSFCPKCNSPVDELGRSEVEKAKSDPLYKRICILAEEIINAQESGSITDAAKDQLSPEILSLLDRYRSLQAEAVKESHPPVVESSGDISDEIMPEHTSSEIKLSDSAADIPDLSSAIEELNALMKSMIPDPGLTQQMQRNYYCARKVAVYRKSIIKEKVGWVCNLCGCYHGSPSECARPELGGTWIYQDKEIIVKTYE